MIVSPITPPSTPNCALKTRDKPDESPDCLVDQLSTAHIDSDDGYCSSETNSPSLNSSPELPKRTTKVDQHVQTLSIKHGKGKLGTSSDDEAIHLFDTTTDIVESSRSQTLPIAQEQENFDTSSDIKPNHLPETTTDVVENSRGQTLSIEQEPENLDASSDAEANHLIEASTSVAKCSSAETLTIYQEQNKLDTLSDDEATHVQECIPPTDRVEKLFIQLLFPLIVSEFRKIQEQFNLHMRQAYAGYGTEWLHAGSRLGSKWKRILVAHNSTALIHQYMISLMDMIRPEAGRQDTSNRMQEEITKCAIQLQRQFSRMHEDLDEAIGIFCNRMRDTMQLMDEVIIYTHPQLQNQLSDEDAISIKQFLNEHIQLLHIWYKGFDIESRNEMTKIKNLLISEMCEAHSRYRFQFVQAIWRISEIGKLEESVALNLNVTDIFLNRVQEKCIYVHRRLIEIQKSQFEEMEQVYNEHEKCKIRTFESMVKELRDLYSYSMN